MTIFVTFCLQVSRSFGLRLVVRDEERCFLRFLDITSGIDFFQCGVDGRNLFGIHVLVEQEEEFLVEGEVF